MEPNQLLEIFVLPACLGCRTAATLAERVRAAALPGVDVRVVDLSDPTAASRVWLSPRTSETLFSAATTSCTGTRR